MHSQDLGSHQIWTRQASTAEGDTDLDVEAARSGLKRDVGGFRASICLRLYFIFSLVGFKGNLSILEILFYFFPARGARLAFPLSLAAQVMWSLMLCLVQHFELHPEVHGAQACSGQRHVG